MAKPSPVFGGNQELVALGRAVRALRKGRALSQEQLAVDADVDRSFMGGIERGEHNITLMVLTRIARALGTKPSVLLNDADL